MKNKIRSLSTLAMSAAENMAMDQFFFDQADRAFDFIPVVRFYSWRNPTLSLGYHQKAGLFNKLLLQREKIEFVRRQTGGRAVLHDQELTYSVIGKKKGLLGNTIGEIFLSVSESLVDGLCSLGVKALVSRVTGTNRINSGSVDLPCFASTSKFEVTCGGKKLVGSAQRQTQNAFLQHGSILLKPSHYFVSDFLDISLDDKNRLNKAEVLHRVTLSDYEGVSLDILNVIDHIKNGFKNHLKADFESVKINADDQKKIEAIEGSRYQLKEWNFKC